MAKTIEFIPHRRDFFNDQPEYLNNEEDGYGKMVLVDAYGLIFPDGQDRAPVLYVRHGNPDSYRFGGFCRLSDDPVGLQTPLHDEDLAQKEETGPFRLISEEPFCYGYGTKEPFSEYRYYDGYGTWKETDVLDVKAEPFPY